MATSLTAVSFSVFYMFSKLLKLFKGGEILQHNFAINFQKGVNRLGTTHKHAVVLVVVGQSQQQCLKTLANKTKTLKV